MYKTTRLISQIRWRRRQLGQGRVAERDAVRLEQRNVDDLVPHSIPVIYGRRPRRRLPGLPVDARKPVPRVVRRRRARAAPRGTAERARLEGVELGHAPTIMRPFLPRGFGSVADLRQMICVVVFEFVLLPFWKAYPVYHHNHKVLTMSE